MATEARAAVERLRESALDLAWSLWAECGVSTWSTRSHADWAIELEPLLVLTALLAPHDPRLLRETVDWCTKNERLLSLTQLRHVVTSERWPFKGEIAAFGATAGRFSRKRWPGVTDERAAAISLSGQSTDPDLGNPALVQLRLRATFGVSARAEIIRALLTRTAEWSVQQVAERVAYTRRQVALDLDMLVAGKVLHRSSGRPATYALADPLGLLRFVGDLPPYAPRWAPVFRVLTGMMAAFENLQAHAAPATELRRRVRRFEDSAERAGLSLPPAHGEHDDVERLLRWSDETFSSLARGQPSALRADRVMSTTVPPHR